MVGAVSDMRAVPRRAGFHSWEWSWSRRGSSGMTESTHVLLLNDMRSPKIGQLSIAAQGTWSELDALMDDERVETYVDGRFRKPFRRGGPLEWFNLPSLLTEAIIAVPQGEPGQNFADGYIAAMRHFMGAP
jgi:hypothetical protein